MHRYRMPLGVVISAAIVLNCTDRGRVPPSAAPRLTGDSVGPVAVGALRAQLSRVGRVLRDTMELGDEAIPESVAVVVVAGDTVRAIIDSARVYRIDVTTAHFRTVDSLGVGTTLERLLREPGVHAFTGEVDVYVKVPRHCGLRFRLANAGELGDAPDSVGPVQLRGLPVATPVSTVLVVGCRRSLTE